MRFSETNDVYSNPGLLFQPDGEPLPVVCSITDHNEESITFWLRFHTVSLTRKEAWRIAEILRGYAVTGKLPSASTMNDPICGGDG
jgi:hypothetical protein